MKINAPEKRFFINFNQGFFPERNYLSNMISLAFQGFTGTKEEVSNRSGIPTGTSSGKVEPHIKYAQSMGLVLAAYAQKKWKLEITPFGKIIFKEDQYLTDNMTLWLLHIMLCNYKFGAEVWYRLFAESTILLGEKFTRNDYYAFMKNKINCDDARRLNNTLTMYAEDSSFGHINPLSVEENSISRNPAPFNQDFFRGYASVMFLLWDISFEEDKQVILDEFASITSFFDILGWNNDMRASFIEALALFGYVALDKQAGATLILRREPTQNILNATYQDLI